MEQMEQPGPTRLPEFLVAANDTWKCKKKNVTKGWITNKVQAWVDYIIHLDFKAIIKAKLLLLKLIHLFARKVLSVKKLEIKETKTTWYSTFKTDIIKVGLVFQFPTFSSMKCFWQINGWGKKYHIAVIQLYAP